MDVGHLETLHIDVLPDAPIAIPEKFVNVHQGDVRPVHDPPKVVLCPPQGIHGAEIDWILLNLHAHLPAFAGIVASLGDKNALPGLLNPLPPLSFLLLIEDT